MEDSGLIITIGIICLIAGIFIGVQCVKDDYNIKLCNYKNGKYINNICVSNENYIDLSK